MTTTHTPATTSATKTLQIDLDKLTTILDASNEIWRAVVTAPTPGDRIAYLRQHVAHIRQYLAALDDSLPG